MEGTELIAELEQHGPSWFLANIKQPGTPIVTLINGRQVNMLSWGWDKTELPVLLLVHGFGAHAHWWSFLAPFFSDRYRVLALDLPGMGDSEPPQVYDDDCFAEAIVGCLQHHGLRSVTIVGHSFGGTQSLRAMAMAPTLFEQGIVIDSNIRLDPEPAIRKLAAKDSHRPSASLSECAARFRMMPPRPNYLEPLVQYIGHYACKETTQGWVWKSDPGCINVGEIETPHILQAVSTPVDLIYGKQSFLNPDNKARKVRSHLKNPRQLIEIYGSGHHIMMEYPDELVAAINFLITP